MTVGKLNIPTWLASVVIGVVMTAVIGLCATVLATQSDHGERITAEETLSREVLRRLESLDTKLDKLLDRQ